MNHPLNWQKEFPRDLPEGWSGRAAALMRVQSLTAALRALEHDFTVEVLYLGETDAGDGQQIRFVRDVLLHLDGVPVVKARSACSPQSRVWRGLLDCGTQPLGERLFDGSLPLKRSAFEFGLVEGEDEQDVFRRPVAARRSCFDWQGEVLELTEYFLPELLGFVRRADGRKSE